MSAETALDRHRDGDLHLTGGALGERRFDSAKQLGVPQQHGERAALDRLLQ